MATLSSQAPLEVRCAGCGETLEVEPGLTEFICPDCHTPQALPPELMPRKRKALPLPRGVDSSKIQLPCGSCSALLNVPHGLARFVCPKCGVELGVDQERLKGYLAGSSVAAAEVAFVMPSAVRIPIAVDVEPQLQNQINATDSSLKAPLFSPDANIEQNHMITPSRAPLTASIDSEHLDRSTVSSMKLISSSTNANNIHTSIPSSITPLPCRLNSQQIEEELSEEEQEAARTPPHTTKIKPINNKKRNNKNKKQSPGPTTKEIEPSLRRSKRIAQSSPPTKKQKTQSQPSQSQPSQTHLIESQPSQSEDYETPLDIARHYNNLLSDPLSPNPEGDVNNNNNNNNNSDGEGGEEAYAAESDSSQSEPDSNFEPEPDSVLQMVLRDAEKRRGLIPGKRRKSKSTPGKRGPSKCLDIWDRPDDDPIEIEFNSVGQPIGEQAYALSNFLGSVSRDGKIVPLNYKDWRAVPVKYKDMIWYIVKSKFKVEIENRRYILKATGRNWNSWKSRLKKAHYDTHDNDEDRLADIDVRIEAEQWPFLVQFWGSDASKKRSAKNKACAKMQKTYHSMGRKSFARVREEERLKRESKEEPCRAEMFILTHTRKDGTPIDEESAQIIARLREELEKADASANKTLKNDILAKVLGKERHIRTYGLMATKPENWGGPRDRDERDRVISEARKIADAEAKPMKEKMEAMERRHKEMEMEMMLMRKSMMAMQTGSVPPGF